MSTKPHKTIVITIFMALFVMSALTASAYTYNPPIRQAAHISQNDPTGLITSKMVKQSTSSRKDMRLRLRHSIGGGPNILVKRGEFARLLPNAVYEKEAVFKLNQFTVRQASRQPALPIGYDLERDRRKDSQENSERSRMSTICTVTTSANSGAGSLRQCLLEAVQGDTIDFDPQVFPPSTPATIALLSELPSITSDNLTIDGSNAGVVLDGGGLDSNHGLVIYDANAVTIQGLQVLNFPEIGIALAGGTTNALIGGDRSVGSGPLGQGNLLSNNGESGIWIEGIGTTDNQVQGNYIGSDLTGAVSLGNTWGVFIGFGAENNLVGGETEGTGNLISGNTQSGIHIQDEGTSGNQVLGNYIGTDATGIAAVSNNNGILIGFGADNNIIGGTTANLRNIISGNTAAGIKIQNAETSENQVLGNYIGTDLTGTASLGNQDGVLIRSGAENNVVGGETEGAGNLISGNTDIGIYIQNLATNGNQVLGNYIGTNATGTAPLSNLFGLVISDSSQDNVVGGEMTGARNIISGNTDYGILITDEETSNNQVQGNYIGTDPTGTSSVANRLGILIALGANNNIIGGTTTDVRNLISGNTGTGILLQNAGTNENQLLGNYIGTNATGTASLGNFYGIMILDRSQDNVIGGEMTGARNIISGNTKVGIQIQHNETRNNQVMGNYIGTDAMGTSPLGNTNGIVILFGAQENIIGGNTTNARNIISGNTEAGIQLEDQGTTGNQIRGNYIGIDVTGTALMGNTWGIAITFGAQGNVVGGNTADARNVVSGNSEVGILLQDEGTDQNQILGNYIGLDATGEAALGNLRGVGISHGAQDNLIGSHKNMVGCETLTTRNVISGNSLAGVQIQNEGTTSNQVLGNYIGTDKMGIASVGNADGIVIGFGAQNNMIGGETTGACNLISGNIDVGIVLQDANTTGNQVRGNYIGTNAAGVGRLDNSDGVLILDGPQDNSIGSGNVASRNLISGNREAGIRIIDNVPTRNQMLGRTSGNKVLSNYIGTVITGTAPLSNTWGIVISFGAQDNIIGGNSVDDRNLISGNSNAAILIKDEGTAGNEVIGNNIGTDAFGSESIPNGGAGIHFQEGATANTIGISNTIAYNGLAGVAIEGYTALQNTIQRNMIYENNQKSIDWMDIDSLPALPTLISYSNKVLLGSTCGECRVEIFAGSSVELSEGRVFVGEVTANANGDFTLTLNSSPSLCYLSATATDPDGNTSEFSSALSALETCDPTAITTTSIATGVPKFPPDVPYLAFTAVILGMIVFWKSIRKLQN